MSKVGELLARPFAHRGLHSSGCPENSPAAFEAAVRRGFAIELDVRLSADGVPVVFHDGDLARMCGVDERVSRLRARDLCRLRLAGTDETIPTLVSVMHGVAGNTPVLVDLKAPVGRRRLLADAAAILLRAYRGPVGVVGFDPWLLQAMRMRAPGLLRGQSAGVDARFTATWAGRRVCHPVDELWSLRLSTPDFVTFNVDRMPSDAVRRVRRQLPVVAWTVRSPESYRLARASADSVIVEGAAVELAERALPTGDAPYSTLTRSPVTR